jgi:hypothetical protein
MTIEEIKQVAEFFAECVKRNLHPPSIAIHSDHPGARLFRGED